MYKVWLFLMVCSPRCSQCNNIQYKYHEDAIEDFRFNLTIINVLASNVEIKINALFNHKLSNATNIQVRYKKLFSKEVFYKNCDFDKICNITNLDLMQTYDICVFPLDLNKCFDRKSFTMKCVGLTATNFDLTTGKRICTINVIDAAFLNYDNCPLKKYMIIIEGKSMLLRKSNFIEELTPFTNYSIKVKFMLHSKYLINPNTTEIILNVITKPSEAGKVQNLIYHEINNSITFDKPKNSYGNIEKYELNVNVIKYIASDCTNKIVDSKRYFTQNLFFQFENFNFYYRIVGFEVIAINEAGHGFPATTEFSFKESDTVTEEEKLASVAFENNTINIKLPDCDKIFGPLIYHFIYDCNGDLCMNRTKIYQTLNVVISGNKLKIPDLIPFSTYKATLMYFCRDKTHSCLNATGTSITFKTKPSAPPKVRNLESFMQNETNIGIRFKETIPSFGELEYYNITYCKNNNCSFITKTYFCNLWNDYIDYQCANINNLEKNVDYKITVYRVNLNVSNIGNETAIIVETKEKASSPPLNVDFCIFENNTIQLRWEFPKTPNGLIRNFIIQTRIVRAMNLKSRSSDYTIIEKNLSAIEIKSSYDFNLDNLQHSSVYHLFIRAESSIIGEKNDKLEISTYPKKPKFENEITIKCNITHCQFIMIDIEDLLPHNKMCIYKIKNGGSENFEDIEAQNKCLFIETIDRKKSEIFFKTCNQTNKTISDKYHLRIFVYNEFNNKRSYLNKKIISIDAQLNQESTLMASLLHSLWLFIIFLFSIVILILWITYRFGKLCRKKKHVNIKQNEIISAASCMKGILNCSFGANILYSVWHIPEYMELPPINKKNLKKILSRSFGNFIKLVLKDEHVITKLEEEFENIPTTINLPCNVGNEAENKLKSRHKDIIPYDKTLVKLKGIPGLEYINASYVKTPFGNKTIIATQCPQLNTFYDFWRMIWQENVPIIICLVSNSEKEGNFFQYWPETLNEKIMKGITIQHKDEEIYTDYIVTNLEIKINDDLERTIFRVASRKIKLFRFLSWPSDDIPINPLSYYYFLRDVEEYDTDLYPIVVHCSCGYGRTGTFIMTYNLIKHNKEIIDIPEELTALRNCRPNLITQGIQYRFIYYIADEFMNGTRKSLNWTELFTKVNKLKDNELLKDLKYVTSRLYINKILYSYKVNTLITPDDCSNVVYINGYEKENNFVSMQYPTTDTIEKFWRMIFSKEIKLLISLHEMGEEFNLCPSDSKIMDFESLEVILVNKEDTDSLAIYSIKLINPSNMESFRCKLIRFKHWKFNQIIARNYRAFVDLYNLYKTETYASMDNSPILLTCVDGYTACGLFIAVDLVLKKFKNTQKFNIIWAVQSIQKSRGEFISNKEQFKFLYEFSLYYNNKENRENPNVCPTYLLPVKKV